jgi:2-dehydropantoate 2-reductase
MAKTPLGKIAASDHCRAAAEEMEALDNAFRRLRGERPEVPMRPGKR